MESYIVKKFKEFLKSVKTPSLEQIAKKHKVSVAEIEKEHAMGVSVEQEHTKNKKMASEIARDHLKELPDYYTRLKKVENK